MGGASILTAVVHKALDIEPPLAVPVALYCSIGVGLPCFLVEGVEAADERTTRDRVRAAALNQGYPWPQRAMFVTASRRLGRQLCSAALDLPIALGMLAAADLIEAPPPGVAVLGSLNLDGATVVPAGLETLIHAVVEHDGLRALIVPAAAAQVAMVHTPDTVSVFGVEDLRAAARMCEHLRSNPETFLDGDEWGWPRVWPPEAVR